MSFSQAHALIIGIGTYADEPRLNVPITATDAHALAELLCDPQTCGYPPEQVKLLTNAAATRDAILAALDDLAQRSNADSTVLLFYSGHGFPSSDGNYHLSSHDSETSGSRLVAGTGVSQQELLTKLRAIPAQRLLLLINACHAGSVSPVLGDAEPPPTGENLPAATAAALLATGTGRVIITACRENQYSYVGNGKLTIFTQTLVDGLRGRGMEIVNRQGFISVFDLYTHIYATLQEQVDRQVPASVRQTYSAQQEPELTVLKGIGPFAVALYRGASTLGAFSAPERPAITNALREVDRAQSERLLNQLLHIEAGRDVNQAGRDINQAGRDNLAGAQFGGNYTGGDRITQSGGTNFGRGNQFRDVTIDGIAGRDNIRVGDITGSSGIAIGSGAQAFVSGPRNGSDLSVHFVPIYQRIAASGDPPAISSLVVEQVKAIEATAGQGNVAQVTNALAVLSRLAPQIHQLTVTMLLNVPGLAPAVQAALRAQQ